MHYPKEKIYLDDYWVSSLIFGQDNSSWRCCNLDAIKISSIAFGTFYFDLFFPVFVNTRCSITECEIIINKYYIIVLLWICIAILTFKIPLSVMDYPVVSLSRYQTSSSAFKSRFSSNGYVLLLRQSLLLTQWAKKLQNSAK